MEIKKNLSLILAISIPILMILLVAGSIYLPNLFYQQPKFNFLYAVSNDYYCAKQYSVQNRKLVKNEIEHPKNCYGCPHAEPKLFVHDVVKNESKQVSFEEAQTLDLDSNIKSPDGFEIVYGSHDSGIFPFFFGYDGDYNTRYLKYRNISKKQNIQIGERYNSFNFLGWIKRG